MAPGYQHLGLEALFAMARKTPLELTRERFIFVRHGETDGNRLKIFQFAEQPLNAAGIAQAEAAAAALAGHRVGAIRASTMRRAWHTAEIVGRPHGIVPEPHDDLRERWFGDLVGTPSRRHDWRHSPPNGETLEYFVMRTQRGLHKALSGNGDATVVAHGGTLYVLAPSLGLDLDDNLYANATPLLFERSGPRWRATRLADTGAESNNIV